MKKAAELCRAIGLARFKLEGDGAILVLLDADDDCPAELAPKLQASARKCAGTTPVCVIMAKSEFESWFLAALPSLRGRRGIVADAPEVYDPENIRDAKGRLEEHMGNGATYSETVDQPAMAALFDIDMARSKSPSFDKFMRDIESILAQPHQPGLT
jgi:hypothetical protein